MQQWRFATRWRNRQSHRERPERTCLRLRSKVARSAGDPSSLCSGRKAGADVVCGRTADRDQLIDFLILRATEWIADRSGSAGARAMDSARVINSNAQFFSIEAWSGGTWRGSTILTRGDNTLAGIGRNSMEWFPAEIGNCPNPLTNNQLGERADISFGP